MPPKTPFRIRLIQLVALATLVFVGLTWWQFLSSSRTDTVPPRLIVRWSPYSPGLELLADKKFQVVDIRLLPSGEATSGTDCLEAKSQLPSHHRVWDDWSHTIRDSDRERTTSVINGREYQEKIVSIDGREYREESFVNILGNHHGYSYCLEVINLWGYPQTVISQPIKLPVWPVDSRLTDTELIVQLVLSPEIEIGDPYPWLKGHLSYERPRHPSSYEHPESCLSINEISGDFDFESEEVPLDLVGSSFSSQPEGIQLELSIPLYLLGPQSSCYYVYLIIEDVGAYFIHDSRQLNPQRPLLEGANHD